MKINSFKEVVKVEDCKQVWEKDFGQVEREGYNVGFV